MKGQTSMRLFFCGSLQKKEDTELFNKAAFELGYNAAEKNHTILIGSTAKHTADYHIMKGAIKYCNENPNKTTQVEVHSPERSRPVYTEIPKNLKISKMFYHADPNSSWVIAHVRALDSCDLLITIGGGKNTRLIGHLSSEREIPTIAIPVFGGSSEDLFDKLKLVYKLKYNLDKDIHYFTKSWSENSANDFMNIIDSFNKSEIQTNSHVYFLSYCWKDSHIADHIEALLRRHNKIVFRDESNLKAGKRLTNSVSALIEKADTVISVWSKKYADSTWCNNELEFSRNCKKNRSKRIVLLRCDDYELPFHFNDILSYSGNDRFQRELSILKLIEEQE